MVSFDMDGNIYPCELTDWEDEIIGNIYSGEDLFDMIANGIRTKAYFNDRKKNECSCCPWYYYCRGGCSAAIKYRNGNRNGIDEMECKYNKTVYPRIIEHILNNSGV